MIIIIRKDTSRKPKTILIPPKHIWIIFLQQAQNISSEPTACSSSQRMNQKETLQRITLLHRL